MDRSDHCSRGSLPRLLGQPYEITYRVAAAGCGVTALQLDGASLPYAEEAHPYRRGAARVALAALTEGAQGVRARRLEIDVGAPDGGLRLSVAGT